MSSTRRYKQFEDVVIDDLEVDEWPHPRHNHNYYELVFIAHGSGWHYLNESALAYRTGDLYLLGPEDAHEFRVERRTRFLYFKFTQLYLSQQADQPLPGNWNQDVDGILHSPRRKKGNLLDDETDRRTVAGIMKIIVSEYGAGKLLNRKIIYQLFSVVMLILQRNRISSNVSNARSGIAAELMEYVEVNIYQPRRLTLEAMANHFNYSSNYIGILFREKTGVSLRRYAGDFRLRLIEERLKDSRIGLKQIVSEFGFVDESHLYKFFLRKKGQKISELRR